MGSRVVLVKLAAIGDVAVACRALNDFNSRHELSDAGLDLHWIIDQNLVELAQALLNSGIHVTWHAVNSTHIFQGSPTQKALEAFQLLKTVATLRPEHLLMFHRDWRYKALLRPVFAGSLSSVTRSSIHEFAAYQRLFDTLASHLKLPRRTAPPQAPTPSVPSGRIGILVGGARSQKVDFAEKRWPRMPELTRLLLERTSAKIALFGGPDDTAAAETILSETGTNTRIENLVGKLSLAQIPAALTNLDAFISIDSGLAHIAAAVMTAKHQRIITLFGPTDPLIWAPLASGDATTKLHYKARPCSPCYSNDGSFQPCRFEGEYFQHCMTDISAEEIFKALH